MRDLEHGKLAVRIGEHLRYLREMGIGELRIPKGKARPAVRGPVPPGRPGLEAVRRDLGDCVRCPLHQGRRHIVFGEGNPDAELVFIGEAPGRDEDFQGRPFVGRAGRLLTQIIEAMGLRREDVYIGNILKCRPPNNRTPQREEISTCSPFLYRQLRAIRPRVVCTLGSIAAQALLQTQDPISRLRGRFIEREGMLFFPTFHPAYLLRNPEKKREVWKDMQQIMARLGLRPSPRRPAGRPGGGYRRPR